MTRLRLPQALKSTGQQISARPATTDASPEPMDENALAREIARILERPTSTASPTASASRKQFRQRAWLGDEADQAVVNAYVARSQNSEQATPADDVGPDGTSKEAEEFDVAELKRYETHTPASWVRQAKRQRFRARVRDAAGWTVSIAVSIIVVGAAGLALYGWPKSNAVLQQLPVRSVNVSAVVTPSRPGNPVDKLAGTTPQIVSAADTTQ